jgi:hypothetical protein
MPLIHETMREGLRRQRPREERNGGLKPKARRQAPILVRTSIKNESGAWRHAHILRYRPATSLHFYITIFVPFIWKVTMRRK